MTADMKRRVVPNDNDCLFSCFSYLCEGGKYSPAACRALRAHVAAVVAADPAGYCAAVLARPVAF